VTRAIAAQALAMIIILAACTSPEATRQRAGGAGADVGNRGTVQLHSGTNPYYRTPKALPSPHESTPVAASAASR
jgi:hypothetical protein